MPNSEISGWRLSGRSRAMRILAFAWAACLGLAGSSPAVEIYFFQRGYVEGGTGAATRLTDEAVAAFEKLRPDVAVRIVGVPWGKEGDLKLRTALLARRRIDIFRLAHDQLDAFLPRRGSLLAPVEGEFSDADRADFGAAALAAVTRRGRVWAWPLWSTALALIANRDLLDARGIRPPEGQPWTWDEFLAALERVSARPAAGADVDRRVRGFNAAARPPLFEWAPLLMAHCGPLFVEGAAPAADGALPLAPGLAGALARAAALREADLAAPGFGVDDAPAVQAEFLAGRTAFLFTSPGFLKTLREKNFPFIVLPTPTGNWGRPITTGALGCLAVVESGDPARVAAAQTLARFLTSAEIVRAVPGWYLAPPARSSAEESYADDSALAPLAGILATSSYMTPPVSMGFMEETFIPQLQAALLGQVSPDEAIQNIQSAARRLSMR